jgi:hypothetical protein
MLIKVTYFGKDRPTIINIDKIESMYQKIDRNSNRICTNIQFGKENYILVEESLQDILKLIENAKSGIAIGDIETQTFDQLMEHSFQGQQEVIRNDYQRPPQRRNYNNARPQYYNDNYNRY